jgi:hypothetical protein
MNGRVKVRAPDGSRFHPFDGHLKYRTKTRPRRVDFQGFCRFFQELVPKLTEFWNKLNYPNIL